jgi:hypothetical protein
MNKLRPPTSTLPTILQGSTSNTGSVGDDFNVGVGGKLVGVAVGKGVSVGSSVLVGRGVSVGGRAVLLGTITTGDVALGRTIGVP